jgi:hypothetical protein
MKKIAWYIPIKIVSESNISQHWSVKRKRHVAQKKWIQAFFLRERPEVTFPCTVTLTRVAPRFLDDHDNLRVSLKWVVDEIAAQITGNTVPGRADGDDRITWLYSQEKGSVREYALIVEIESV